MHEKLRESKHTVRKWMCWSMLAGFIPVPYVDIATVAALQLRMLADLAKQHGVAFASIRVSCLAAALVGGALPGTLAGTVVGGAVKAIPIVGPVVGGIAVPLLAGASTYAVGIIFMRHFESGRAHTRSDRDEP